MQKNKKFCFVIASILLHCFSKSSMEVPSIQQQANSPFHHSSQIFPPIPPHNKPILGFEIKDLAQLAPIAISMYCFNEFPRFTMICLSMMLIYTITAKEIFKKKEQNIVYKFKKYCKKIYQLMINSFE